MPSDATVRAAKSKATPYKLTDTGGLHLYITLAGGKLWRLRYHIGHREKLSITVAFLVSCGRVLRWPDVRGAKLTRQGRALGGYGAVQGAWQHGGSPGAISG